MQQDDAAARAAQRATPEERIEMMWELAVRSFGMAGIPIPDYDRAHMPIRIVRRGEENS